MDSIGQQRTAKAYQEELKQDMVLSNRPQTPAAVNDTGKLSSGGKNILKDTPPT